MYAESEMSTTREGVMSATFYSVLGVGPEADEGMIRRGYRQRVKEVHPDVNDDPDADSQFKRIQTARETLLDAGERARYDRLGHASYVRQHVDCSAWHSSQPGTGQASGTADARYGASPTGRRTARASRSRTDGTGDGSATAGRTASGTTTGRSTGSRDSDDKSSASYTYGDPPWERSESGGGTDDDGGADADRDEATGTGRDNGDRSEATRERTGASNGAGTGRSWDTVGATGGDGGTNTASTSASASRRTPGSTSARSSGSEAGAAEATGGGSASYARSSFWEATPTDDRYATSTGRSDPLTWRLYRGLRALGPWAFIHLIFLSAAVGTCVYVYTVVLANTAVSVPLLLVLIGEVALAMSLSTVHIASRLYR